MQEKNVPSPSIFNIVQRDSLNVYPTDYCNHACVFCKMQAVAGSLARRRQMDRAGLARLIAFCKRSGVSKLRILGGEPSQHPDMPGMIEEIYARGLSVSIFFTNGIFNDPRLIETIRRHRIVVNFHYFPADDYAAGERDLAESNLRSIQAGTGLVRSLSIIFYRPGQEYRYILDAARRFGVGQVTFSLAHPSMTAKNCHVTWSRARALLPTAAAFVRAAVKAGRSTCLECPVTPCLFTPAQLQLFRKHVLDLSFVCEPILDVFPDLSVHYCMGMPIVSRITAGNTVRDILVEQWRRSQPLRQRPRARRCLDCWWWQTRRCQGYCLHEKIRRSDFKAGGTLNGLSWKRSYERTSS